MSNPTEPHVNALNNAVVYDWLVKSCRHLAAVTTTGNEPRESTFFSRCKPFGPIPFLRPASSVLVLHQRLRQVSHCLSFVVSIVSCQANTSITPLHLVIYSIFILELTDPHRLSPSGPVAL